MAQSTLSSPRARLLAYGERHLPALTRLKSSEPLPIVLHRRRIYVLPSRFGIGFSIILLVMLLGALNYNNNPAMLLTCLLGAAAYQSVFGGFRTLNRVELHAIHAQPCNAGNTLQLSLLFHAPGPAKQDLCLRLDNAETDDEKHFAIPAQNTQSVDVELTAPHRGWQAIGRIRLHTEYPLGLFHVWSWLHPSFRALIFPRPEANAPPLPNTSGTTSAQQHVHNDDELGQLRDYQPSDTRRRIAWKASARHDRLLVKDFDHHSGSETVLAWHQLEGLDFEARISRLTAWVYRCEVAHTPYVLQLPSAQFGPGLGQEHCNACLRELALLPGAAT